jgi:putative hydrolase of the HAD superfamily
MRCLVLDAMGVLFQAADDVVELLIPFVAEHGGEEREDIVQSAYLDASLGRIAADEFWDKVGVDAKREDDYLTRHRLSNGVAELMEIAKQRNIPVWCLSNDVGRWSQKLRENFGLERLLSGAVISSEVRVRKPDRRIYEELVSKSGFPVADILFIDDRPKNVQAAQNLGIESIQYDPLQGFDEIATKVTTLW